MIKVLCVLENFYAGKSGTLINLTYQLDDIVSFKHGSKIYNISLNKKNATYTRIINSFDESKFDVHFAETTPNVGIKRNEKFPVNRKWVYDALKSNNWDLVITFGKTAKNALEKFPYVKFHALPHPVAFSWRKELISDLLTKLNINDT